MWLPELLVPAPTDANAPAEAAAVVRRRRLVVSATLVLGAALLRATLSQPKDSTAFAALGLLLAATWVGGGLLARPPRTRDGRADVSRGAITNSFTGPALLGVAAFVAFLAADLVARHLPVVSHELTRLLPKSDPATALVLVVVVVNAIAEEVFFRGALLAALGGARPGPAAVAIYGLVTLVTLNAALVIAALVMGTLFTLERLSTRGVVAPAVTHVTWSVLVLLLLPR